MDQEVNDQGWQQLQTHIQRFFGQFLQNDSERIEYKPRFRVELLDMPPQYRKTDRGK